MADPTKYSPDYSFTNYQTNLPSRPLPAPELDVELANIATSIDETVEALKDVRRSDGALKNGIVTADTLAPTLRDEIVAGAITDAQASATAAGLSADAAAGSASAAAGSASAASTSASTASTAAGTAVAAKDAVLLIADNLPDWQGPWATATAYGLGDMVQTAGSSYICVIAHTSAASFSTDFGSGRWQLMAAQGAAGPGSGDMVAANNLSDLANAVTARANLGLGTIATQLADNVAITGGAISGITDLAIADGGTGASTADAALTNLGATAAGKAVLTAADAAAQLTALGAAPLASPAFTGAPTAPTQAASDNSTKIATTAFVTAAVADIEPVGVDQEWQDVKASRASNTSYQNTTGRTITAAIRGNANAGGSVQVSTNNITWLTLAEQSDWDRGTFCFPIPPSHYYRFTGGISRWVELR
jgi:hypothetical protein